MNLISTKVCCYQIHREDVIQKGMCFSPQKHLSDTFSREGSASVHLILYIVRLAFDPLNDCLQREKIITYW